MQIPNADRAVIEPAKLHDYLLSRSHPIGRFKAAFFLALGYSSDDWSRLEADLRSQHLAQDATPGQRSSYGQKYTIRATLVGPSGTSAEVVSVWVVHRRGVPSIRDGISGERQMTYRVLDTIVLDRDLPDHGLRKGDLGAVVEVYEPDGLEVEFVTASGRTAAVLTLNVREVRPVADDDLVSVRSCRRSA